MSFELRNILCLNCRMPQEFLIRDNFSPHARALRRVFDERMLEPRHAHQQRFVWDYWHVPEQYNLVRTPAWTYFPKGLYEKFHRQLVEWGRRHLGCHDISPPWLSFYNENCFQNWHADNPHGPWAFVFSLTRWNRRLFAGGETQILRGNTLDFWRDFESGRGVEKEELIREIPPRFNRLLVFDPRLPHGVKRVSGVLDPRHSRLVVHGWFVEPRLFIYGALQPRQVDPRIREFLHRLQREVPELFEASGALCVRLSVNSSGRVHSLRVMTDTLRPLDGKVRNLKSIWMRHLRILELPRARGASQVTLPLLLN